MSITCIIAIIMIIVMVIFIGVAIAKAIKDHKRQKEIDDSYKEFCMKMTKHDTFVL